MKTLEVIFNFTGGIVSPGYLKQLLLIAHRAQVKDLRFSSRQQMRLELPLRFQAQFEAECSNHQIEFFTSVNVSPNIVSSYPAAGIFTEESWLREGVYKDIFAMFNFLPQLEINIVDSKQCFVPLFSGHINWVSSPVEHFWHLYVRFPGSSALYRWKEMIYTNDLPLVSRAIEKAILQEALRDGENLFQIVKSRTTYSGKPLVEIMPIDFALPYYEGFNKQGSELWLGIYRRNERFPIDFMLEVCDICLQTRVGQLYTTPWKSLIVKNISTGSRKLWDLVLGKYRINVRHAANELAWQVEDHTQKGTQLKAHIIRHFDKEDVRTYGLCFAIQTVSTSNLFGSVIIRKQQKKNPHRLSALERFDILHKKDFDPNSSELILFREGVEKDMIGVYLVSLCKVFYTPSPHLTISEYLPEAPHAPEQTAKSIFHQCARCYTVYVPALGDADQGIAPNTRFADLPETFCCTLCEATKAEFIEVVEPEALQATS